MNQKEIYIFVGPPGANKTLYSKTIADFFDALHIAWRDIKVKTNKENKLKLLENSLMNGFGENDKIVLSGFPINKEEAQFLLEILNKEKVTIKSIIQLNINLEEAIFNLENRFFCEKCGFVYRGDSHIVKGNFCSNCGSAMLKNKVDREDIKNEYYAFFESVTDATRILSPISESYFSVSADQPKHFVISSIFEKIKSHEKSIQTIYERKSSSKLNTKLGSFDIIAYLSKIHYTTGLAIIKGDIENKKGVLLRVHSSCITGDIFGSLFCDCGDQLAEALSIIEKNKQGLLIYLFQEGRGINIINKIDAYSLQRKGADTVDANEMLGFPIEMREYTAVRDILNDLKIKSVKILTNNLEKMMELEELGVIVEGRVSLEIKPRKDNKRYLSTKQKRMGHELKLK